jgi:D-alanine-D-alanine ligase
MEPKSMPVRRVEAAGGDLNACESPGSQLKNQDNSEDPPHILVIYSVVESWGRGESFEQIADAETAEIAEAITISLLNQDYAVTTVPIRTLADVGSALAVHDRETTLVFNLCEALGPTSGAESIVPQILDAQGYTYVGGDRANLDRCLDKSLTKRILLERDIPTAPFQVFYTGDETVTVPFPAIVKALNEDCSLGLTKDSVVCAEPALRRQVAHMLATYHQPALVEQFLDGREFLVSLWDNPEPEVLAISQVDYSRAAGERFAFDHFEAKWNNSYPSVCPAPIDEATAHAIAEIALAAYRIMGCRDYGRVDMREADGQFYVLEVNPNPCLAPGSGLAKAARVAGYEYPELARQLVRRAWRRHSQADYATT